jgi:hypothetical protein
MQEQVNKFVNSTRLSVRSETIVIRLFCAFPEWKPYRVFALDSPHYVDITSLEHIVFMRLPAD